MNPIISIIVPCYNQAQYLDKSLQSIIDQDFIDWECIIVNDGSPDNTEQIALEWVNKDNRFKYFTKSNSGVCDTRNFGIAKAEGKYILPLDGDDLISKTYISEAITILEEDTSIKLVYSNAKMFGSINENIEDIPYNFETMLTQNLISCSAVYRKQDFERTRGYNINMAKGLEDWDFWLELLQPTDKVVKLSGYHFFYRIKTISRSTQIDRDKNEALILQIFKNHTDLYLRYFNPIRDRIESQYYKEEQTRLQKTAEHRIGKILFYPFRLIQRIWRKSNK